MEFNTNEVTRLIRHRRSLYPVQYSGESVRREVIQEMLENATWAPTHKLTQPWHFVVFTGDGLKKLADFMSDLYKNVTTANGTFEEKKFKTLSNKPLMASHIIALGMKRDEKERLPEIEEIEAVASAAQNMQLTATAHGVGCYWGSGGITYFEEAKPFFNLGPKDKLLGFLYVGIPKEGRWPRSKRKPVEEKVIWVDSL
jgi:nitroreductase